MAPRAELLAVPDVAERLKVSERTAKRLIHSGQLAHIKIGRLVRVQIDDLETFIDERRRDHVGAAS